MTKKHILSVILGAAALVIASSSFAYATFHETVINNSGYDVLMKLKFHHGLRHPNDLDNKILRAHSTGDFKYKMSRGLMADDAQFGENFYALQGGTKSIIFMLGVLMNTTINNHFLYHCWDHVDLMWSASYVKTHNHNGHVELTINNHRGDVQNNCNYGGDLPLGP